ncbi:MAG: Esterase EstD [Phycisphaerae bacterium]|nr:Esterase EstD [Phycisphaerae bacterium]
MPRFKYLPALLLALLAVLPASHADAQSRPADSPKIKVGRELLALWSGGKADEVVARSEEKMRAAMTAQQLAQAWAAVLFQHGKFVGEDAVEEIPAGDLTAVRFTLRFERSLLKIRFVLTKDDKLTGLWFDAVESIKDNRCPPYAKPDAFREEKLTLRCGEFELPAVLTLPAGDAKELPGVVFVHGSGAHDADETLGPNRVFRDLAWGLAGRGVASIRYVKRTQQYPATLKPEDITLEWETIDDAVAAAELLRGRPELDPARVFILGHSLGGFAAPFIAQRDRRLAGLIMMAANARPLCDLVEDQLNYIFNLDDVISDDEQLQLEQVRKGTAAIRAGRPDDVKEPLLGAPPRYWAELQKRDNVAAALELKLPLLFLQGGRDYQVTLKDFEIWKSKFQGKPHAKLCLFDDLNHLMIAGAGKSSPAEYAKPDYVSEKVVAEVAEWIKLAGRHAPP